MRLSSKSFTGIRNCFVTFKLIWFVFRPFAKSKQVKVFFRASLATPLLRCSWNFLPLGRAILSPATSVDNYARLTSFISSDLSLVRPSRPFPAMWTTFSPSGQNFVRNCRVLSKKERCYWTSKQPSSSWTCWNIVLNRLPLSTKSFIVQFLAVVFARESLVLSVTLSLLFYFRWFLVVVFTLRFEYTSAC